MRFGPFSRPFHRGDVSGDGRLRIGDAVRILRHLFLGHEAPVCPDAADVNDDSALDLTDAVALLGFLFLGDDPPPAPGPPGQPCGVDPDPDTALGCAEYDGC